MYQTHSLAFSGYNMSNDRKMLGTYESHLNSYRSGDKSPPNVARMKSRGGESLNSAYLM